MTLLCYSRARLQIGAALFALSLLGVALCFWVMSGLGHVVGQSAPIAGRVDIIYPVMFLFSAAVLGRLLYLTTSDLAAIRALPDGLEVTGFFGRKLVQWDGLLGGHGVNYGNLLHRNRWFNVRYLLDGSNKTIRVPLVLTKRPSGGHLSLPQKVEEAREAALGRPYTPAGERIEGTGIDHDAAIARYLKAKAEAQAEDPPAAWLAPPSEPAAARQPARPAFGRKGLG